MPSAREPSSCPARGRAAVRRRGTARHPAAALGLAEPLRFERWAGGVHGAAVGNRAEDALWRAARAATLATSPLPTSTADGSSENPSWAA
jgi:hypothetical protein